MNPVCGSESIKGQAGIAVATMERESKMQFDAREVKCWLYVGMTMIYIKKETVLRGRENLNVVFLFLIF